MELNPQNFEIWQSIRHYMQLKSNSIFFSFLLVFVQGRFPEDISWMNL